MNTQKKIEEAQEYIRSAEKRCDSCEKKFGVDFLRRTHFPFSISHLNFLFCSSA